MSRISLSDTGDWKLTHDDQDIRGYSVVDATGRPVGTIDSMVVDTDAEMVSTLVLDDGTEIPAREVTIGDDVVYLSGDVDVAHVTVFGDRGSVVRREAVILDVDPPDDDFRAHHAEAYGTSGRGYDDAATGYRYGYTTAYDDAYRNRSYADAEFDLRTGYAAERDFDADREAIRYGYGRAQRQSR